jgi:subtilisin-like proprotein convertase family protein
MAAGGRPCQDSFMHTYKLVVARTFLGMSAAVYLAASALAFDHDSPGAKHAAPASSSTSAPEPHDARQFVPTDKALMFARQRQFLETHPQARIDNHKGDQRVYGKAFATGPSPAASAEAFKNNHIAMFGAEPADLIAHADFLPPEQGHTLPLMYNRATNTYKFTAVYYSQQRDGVPVYGSRLVVLTRNEPGYPAVLANPDVRPLGNFRVSADEAAAPLPAAALQKFQARFAPAPGGVQIHSTQRVIWAGLQDQEAAPAPGDPRLADNTVLIVNGYDEWRMITDAFTGEVLHEEHLICFGDPVGGTALGMATEGIGSEQCENEVPQVLKYLRVTSGTNSTFTDASGNYTIDPDGASINAVLDGQYFDVDSYNLPDTSESIPVGSPADFLFNSANTDPHVRAQVNTYIEANRVRDFVLQYNPAYPSVSTELNFPARANRTDNFCPGNAWYSPSEQSINFCQAGPSNPNTSWSSVVHHEYGHRLVNAAGSGQGAYGEGSGDVMSVLILDDNRLGLGFFNSCATWLRDASNTCNYVTSGCSTCGSAIHTCGQLLSGCVWETRNNLALTNPGMYIDILAPLAINAMLVHTGTTITPQITVDYLTLDDDDTNILNGTPHYAEINGGFTEHDMPGPALVVGLLTTPASNSTFSGLAGGPFTPAQTVYTVENVEDFAIDYEALSNQPWVDIANSSGTIPANSTINVTVSMGPAAAALSNGVYNAAVSFTNLTNGDGNTTRAVTLEVGRIIYTATGLPAAIPDNNPAGMVNIITVPDNLCVADVDVEVNIAHTSIGQLIVELQSPLGTIVRLHNRTGGTADNINKIYNDGVVPVDGPGVLADFNGRYMGGPWTLKVSDNSSGTTGSLTGWSLRIVPSSPVCPPIAYSQNVTVPVTVTTALNLVGSTATNDPVGLYYIDSLPSHGTLTDPNAGVITTVPHLLLSNANTVLYKPTFGYQGPDGFSFFVNDEVMDSAPAPVDITVGGPQLVYEWNMSINPDWSTMGQWAWGQPTGGGSHNHDPSSGLTGPNVYGYNLAGDYPNSLSPVQYLTTGVIDCSDITDATLKFQRWLGVESATFDHATVDVSNNGTTWTNVFNHTGSALNPTTWTQVSYDISAVADNQPTVYLRWGMGITDTSVTYPGWNIDDVQIWGVQPICPTDIDGSGSINIDDLLLVINNWGQGAGSPADVDGSGIVDIDDLLEVINSWGDC